MLCLAIVFGSKETEAFTAPHRLMDRLSDYSISLNRNEVLGLLSSTASTPKLRERKDQNCYAHTLS